MATTSKPKTTRRQLGQSKYNCLVCEKEKTDKSFYLVKWSPIWKSTGGRCLVCHTCMDNFMEDYSKRYGERFAVKVCCHILDLPYCDKVYNTVIEKNNTFKLGLYTRQINLGQNMMQSFMNSMLNGEIANAADDIKQEEALTAEWTESDVQNRNYVISVCGYDPFAGSDLSETDRIRCFNILAGYCDIEGVAEDNHKIQSVVQLTQSQLQCRKIDECINNELLVKNPDETRIKNYTAAKTQLQSAIAKIAQDNNISSAYNQTSKRGASTLSAKMKEIAEKGFESIYVNKFDIETCEAMKQIADISNRSIMDELTFDANDYADMLKEQRVKLVDAESKIDELTEENRKLKNRIMDLEAKETE